MVFRTLAAKALCGLSLLGLAWAGAEAQAQERWKLHSSYGLKVPIIGTTVPKLVKKISDASNETLLFRVYEPGALVPAIQYFDPVSNGAIDAAWGNGAFVVGKVPALVMFATLPFGPRGGEYLAWMKYGGGAKLQDELHARYNVKSVTCALLAPEASGWFRKEIKSLDDLRGLKMRFAGLGSKVMEKFGVSTQLTAAGDIYPALELGAIDATEVGMPTVDEGLGLFQIAKHYYFPGWHQQATLLDLYMHKPKYEALSAHHKAIIDLACEANITDTFVESEATQFGAMARMQAKGVTIHRWSPEVLAAFEKAWIEVAAAEAEKDAEFKRAWLSYSDFRKQYAIWGKAGYLD